jgi:hypothetical protein
MIEMAMVDSHCLTGAGKTDGPILSHCGKSTFSEGEAAQSKSFPAREVRPDNR